MFDIREGGRGRLAWIMTEVTKESKRDSGKESYCQSEGNELDGHIKL